MVGEPLHVLIAGLLFLGIHFLPASPLRSALVKRMGEGPYRGLFSLASGVLFAWIIWAYGQSSFVEVWAFGKWSRIVATILMLFGFIFFVGAFAGRNPTMAGQEKGLKGATAAPGFLSITRHPFFWAVILWAIAHLLANGDLASIYFFGGLGLLGLIGMPLQDHRLAKARGAEWVTFAAKTSIIPFATAFSGRGKIDWRGIGWVRPLIAVALFAVVMGILHQWLFGVSPHP